MGHVWLLAERYISKKNVSSEKVEAIAAATCRKYLPTYYIKTDGEIDIVAVKKDGFMPIEIKWTNQLRSQDLKQIAKYKNSLILTKSLSQSEISGVKTMPLPLFLVTKASDK